MRLSLIFSQSTVPFVAPFDDNWVFGDAESVDWTLVVVAKNEIRSKLKMDERKSLLDSWLSHDLTSGLMEISINSKNKVKSLLLYFNLWTFAVEVLGKHIEWHILSLWQSTHDTVVCLPEDCLHLECELHRFRFALILHGFGCRWNGFSCDNFRHDCWISEGWLERK